MTSKDTGHLDAQTIADIASLKTQSIAMTNDIKEIKDAIISLNNKFDTLGSSYATQKDLAIVDAKVEAYKAQWNSKAILLIISSSIITLLISFAFASIFIKH